MPYKQCPRHAVFEATIQKLCENVATQGEAMKWMREEMVKQSTILTALSYRKPMSKWLVGIIATISGSLTAIAAHFVGK